MHFLILALMVLLVTIIITTITNLYDLTLIDMPNSDIEVSFVNSFKLYIKR